MDSRNYAFLSYADKSVVYGALVSHGLSGAISPCHDADVDPETGELKKAHHHVLLTFSGKKSLNVMRSLAAEIGSDIVANGYIEPVHDKSAYFTYLYHGDSPDKASYNREDIVCFGGYNPPVDVQQGYLFKRILALIADKEITTFDRLLLCTCDDEEIFGYITGHAYLFDRFLRSLRERG